MNDRLYEISKVSIREDADIVQEREPEKGNFSQTNSLKMR